MNIQLWPATKMKKYIYIYSVILLGALLITNQSNAQVMFRNAEQGINAILPTGWDQIQSVRSATILKLARNSPQNEKARIAVVSDEIPNRRIPSGFDIWHMSDGELRTVAKGNSLLGEEARVLGFGRELIDIHHFVWYKTFSLALDKKLVYEFVYEGIVGSKYYTIRLTSVGEISWFEENQLVFSEFVHSIQIGKQKSSFSLPQDNSNTSTKVGNKGVIVVKKGDSFWTAFGKSVGYQFLKVLGAVLFISVIVAVWKKIKNK